MLAIIPASWKPCHREDLIRIGSDNDGGYVVTRNSLYRSDFLVSLGISYDWTFEEQFAKLNQCEIHCYDHSIDFFFFLKLSVNDIKQRIFLHVPKINMNVVLLPVRYKTFFVNSKRHFKEKVGGNREYETNFEKIFSRIPDDKKVFLKMDIEGSEYEVLDGLKGFYHRIQGLIIEFHDVDTLFDAVQTHIERLKAYYDIVHVHINNCGGISSDGTPRVIEVTFENKKIFSGESRLANLQYPVLGLDGPNNRYMMDYNLGFKE
jgi:hypothetical protein